MANAVREVLPFDVAGEEGPSEGRGWLVAIAVMIALAFGVAVSNLAAPDEGPDAIDAPVAWGA